MTANLKRILLPAIRTTSVLSQEQLVVPCLLIPFLEKGHERRTQGERQPAGRACKKALIADCVERAASKGFPYAVAKKEEGEKRSTLLCQWLAAPY